MIIYNRIRWRGKGRSLSILVRSCATINFMSNDTKTNPVGKAPMPAPEPPAPAPSTFVFQASAKDGAHHAVGFLNLHVLIVPDGRHYFAQCQEIDYAAQGTDMENAKKNFEDGFVATVHHHLTMFGSIAKMLEPIATGQWFDLLNSTKGMEFSVTQTSLHHVLKEAASAAFPYPYTGIKYMQALGAAA